MTVPPPATTPRSRRRAPALRGLAALAGTLGLLGGMAVVAAPPAAAETADTEITELALDAPADPGTTAQRRSAPSPQGEDQSTRADEPEATVLAELGEQEVADFSTLGVTWDSGSTGPMPTVEFRTRTEGEWTGWSTAESEGVEAGQAETADAEGGERTGTDPIYVGESDGVQVRVTGSAETSLRSPEVSLIDSAAIAADEQPRVTAAAASAPGLAARPGYISRKGWGADESLRCGENQIDDTIQAAIVHHTAGVNSYSRSQSASIVRGIYAYHTQTLGWCDIGYNFLIDKYGQIFEGRAGGVDNPVHGAHATDWNTDTVGISFMGNFETASAPGVMLEAGAKVLAWKFDAYYRDPQSKVTLAGKYINRISGHGDVMQTACPGRNVRSQLGWMRDRVDELAGDRRTPIYDRWQSLGGDSGSIGSPRVGERVKGPGRWTLFEDHDFYWSSSTGAHYASGPVRDRYARTGVTPIGFPTSDTLTDYPTAGITTLRLQTGAMVYSRYHGDKVIKAPFYDRWGGEAKLRGLLHSPASEQYTSAGLGVKAQNFYSGRLFDGDGGVQAIYGQFYDYYKALSGTQEAWYGHPIAYQTSSRVDSSVRTQRLSRSTLYIVDGKVTSVRGAVDQAYRSAGAEQSRLGFPTSHTQVAWDGAPYNDFEGGRIVIRDGKTEIRYE